MKPQAWPGRIGRKGLHPCGAQHQGRGSMKKRAQGSVFGVGKIPKAARYAIFGSGTSCHGQGWMLHWTEYDVSCAGFQDHHSLAWNPWHGHSGFWHRERDIQMAPQGEVVHSSYKTWLEVHLMWVHAGLCSESASGAGAGSVKWGIGPCSTADPTRGEAAPAAPSASAPGLLSPPGMSHTMSHTMTLCTPAA